MKNIKRLFKFIIIIAFILVIGFFYVNIRYPLSYEDIVIRKSEEYNLDPFLVAAIINVESSYDPDAISIKQAKGLMQISPQTGKWGSEVLGIEDYKEDMLFYPETNIKIGTWYLNKLLKQFDQDLDLVLMAYNAGSGNVSKWLNNEEYCKDGVNIDIIPFAETKNYLEKIDKNYKIYKFLYRKSLIETEKDDYHISLIKDIKKSIKSIVQ